MVSDDTIDSKFSKMSLAIAKDSGWYQIDMEMGEHYFWGKDKGCNIFNKTCSADELSEFCLEKYATSCSDNHLYMTACNPSIFTENCHLNMNIISCKKHHKASLNLFEFGYDSICLNTQVSLYYNNIK